MQVYCIEIEEVRRHRHEERSRSLSRMRLLGFFSFPSSFEGNFWTPFSDDMFRLNLVGPLCSPRAAIRTSSQSISCSKNIRRPVGPTSAKPPPLFSPELKENPSSFPFWEAPFFVVTFSGTSNKGWFCKSLPLYNKTATTVAVSARTHGLGP